MLEPLLTRVKEYVSELKPSNVARAIFQSRLLHVAYLRSKLPFQKLLKVVVANDIDACMPDQSLLVSDMRKVERGSGGGEKHFHSRHD